MGSSFVENCNYEIREPVLISRSSGPPNELRSTRLGVSVDKEEAGNCCHFSIRGYVAEMRKTNKKICWPFSKLDDRHKLDEHEKLLLPITTTEFRWWNCQNCLRKASTAGAANDNGAAMNSLPQETKIMKPNSHGFEVLPKEHTLEPRMIQADSSINGIGDQKHPSLCCDDRRKATPIEKPIREGIPRFKDIATSSEGVYQISYSMASGASKVETCKGLRDKTGRRKILLGLDANKYGSVSSSHGYTYKSVSMLSKEKSSNIVTRKSKGKDLISELADAEIDAGKWTAMTDSALRFNNKDGQGPSSCKLHMRKEPCENEVRDNGMPKRVHRCFQKVGIHTCKVANMLLGSSDKKSNLNEDLIIKNDEDQHCVGQQGALKGNLQRKKTQKVRLLNDIINSEVPSIFERLQILDENEEACPTIDFCGKPNSSKGKDVLQESRNHVRIEEKRINPIKSKKRNEMPEVEDEGPSLIQWLNRMPKKVKTLKLDGQSKCCDSGVGSQSTTNKATEKGLRSVVKDCGVIQENVRKVVVEKKINGIPQEETGGPWPVPWKEGTAGKFFAITDDASGKQLKTGVVHPKKPGNGVTKSTLHSNHQIFYGPNRTDMTTEKPPEVDVYSFMHRPKDSVNTFKINYGTMSGFEAQQKVSKKRSTRRKNCVGDGAAVDGIPIEILELLQKNWHQRNIMNVMDADQSTENMDDLSEMTKNVNDGSSFFNECNRKEAPSAPHKSQTMQYSVSSHTGGDVGTAVKSKGGTYQELNAYPSHGNFERGIHISMNLGEQYYVPKETAGHAQIGEQPNNRGQFHVTGSSRDCFSQNHSLNRIMMQNADSHHEARAIYGQDSCRLAPPESFEMSKSRNIYPDVYQVNRFSQCMFPISHSHKGTHSEADVFINQTVYQPHRRKRKVDLMPNKRTPLARTSSHMEVENEMRLVDLYTKDTISAMHLLRLMDPAVSSSTPLDTTDKKQKEFCNNTEFSHTYCTREILQNVAGVVTSEAPKNPLMLGHIGQNETPKNSTKVFCPVPRIGVPKSLFQKDMTIDLNSLATPSTYKDREFSEIDSFSLLACENAKNNMSLLTTMARTSSQSSVYLERKSHRPLLPSLDPIANSQLSRNKDEVVQPHGSCSQTEFCVVNRNPAEFTFPDEDNVYMMRCETSKTRSVSPFGNREAPTYTDGQRRQRVMKLTALKGLLRS